MASTGGLIPMHSHENKKVLDALSENESQQLLFHDKLIDAAISEEKYNLVKRKIDGLFVDGEVLGQFTYINGVLKFKGIRRRICQRYDI